MSIRHSLIMGLGALFPSLLALMSSPTSVSTTTSTTLMGHSPAIRLVGSFVVSHSSTVWTTMRPSAQLSNQPLSALSSASPPHGQGQSTNLLSRMPFTMAVMRRPSTTSSLLASSTHLHLIISICCKIPSTSLKQATHAHVAPMVC